MINRVSLAEAIRAIGAAFVYAGDPTVAGGMVALGATEGDIEVEELESYNDLTAPEYTGGAVHQRKVAQEGALVTIPLVIGPQVGGGADDGTSIYDMISSLGDGSGAGHAEQQDAVETTLLIIPKTEVAAAGLSFGGGPPAVWAPAAPKHAIWLWRAVAEVSAMSFPHENGGKFIRSVPFRSLFDDSKPAGHKLWTRGDPDAAGIAIEI